MNLNEDDLNTSDAWLSEQLFAQLRDLKTTYKESNTSPDYLLTETFQNCNSSMPLLDDDISWQELKPTSLDTFEEVNTLTSNYDISEVLDLSQTHLKERKSVSLDTFETLNTLSNNYDVHKVLNLSPNDSNECQLGSPQVEINLLDLVGNISLEAVSNSSNVNEVSVKFLPPQFDATEEELKMLKFLENQMTVTNNNIVIDANTETQIVPFLAKHSIRCVNCNGMFNNEDFNTHICCNKGKSTPKNQTTIASNSCKTIKEENVLPIEPACIRLLRENQIRIRRFLKDELKYDVISSFNGSAGASATHSVSNISNASSNASLNNKKQDGPHECTLCERKFVHASGLLRHMEKHALDLIPSSNVTSNIKNAALQGEHGISGLRVVIKCTLCGRIFFTANEAINHLYSHFPDSATEENEIDNCAEIPYDAYVDDAYNNLKSEVDPIYNPTSSCQNNKTPVYLKVVILSCILQCEFCDLVFSEVSYLFVHSACHLPYRRFECFACDIHARTSKEICNHWHAECVFMRENLKVHQATTQRYFVCNVCENKFVAMDLLHEHRYTSYHFFPRLNKITGLLQLPCEYCESIFETAKECVAHYEEKHYRKYKRDKDGTTGSAKTRQYLCEICGKSYTQSSHLWQHLRFHQGVKPFACKEPGCTRKFTIRPDLNDHIRKCHTGERPYHCLVCGKRFLTGSVFYQHRLIHRGERRYECEACGKRFYRADALKNHQRIHTGEKPFGCHFCTKNFRQRGDRDKHIRARHSHLDANARLMMQMQKLQLEAAAQPEDSQKFVTTNYHDYMSSGNGNMPLPDYNSSEVSYIRNNSFNDILMIGNMEFSKNVFESIMSDIIN